MPNIIKIDVIVKAYTDYKFTINFLADNGEISASSDSAILYTKILTIGAASYFETQFKEVVENYFYMHTKKKEIINFAKAKGFERQFHTWFSWKDNNANAFFALFGQDFKSKATKFVRDNELEKCISDFMEIGRERNRITHENIMAAPINKTLEEIYDQYISARLFPETMSTIFKYCSN